MHVRNKVYCPSLKMYIQGIFTLHIFLKSTAVSKYLGLIIYTTTTLIKYVYVPKNLCSSLRATNSNIEESDHTQSIFCQLK